MGVLEIFEGCPGEISYNSLNYFICFLEIFIDFLEIFHRFHGDIS